jgi:hypothetical protein
VLSFIRKHYATLVFSVGVMCMLGSWSNSREAWVAVKAAQSHADWADKVLARTQKAMERAESEASRAADNAKDARQSAEIVTTSANTVSNYMDKLTEVLVSVRTAASLQTAEVKPPRPTVGPSGVLLE